MSIPVAIGSTFFGCMSNVVFLELLVKYVLNKYYLYLQHLVKFI